MRFNFYTLSVLISYLSILTACGGGRNVGLNNFGDVVENSQIVVFQPEDIYFKEGGVLITKKIQEPALIDLLVTFDGGSTIENIDYSQYSVMGIGTVVGGCEEILEKRVSIKEKIKKVTYIVRHEGVGNCPQVFSTMNWVLVPKINPKWDVEFWREGE